jgi:hypothetical protein
MDEGDEREMILILADISGYTRFMMSNRTAVIHAQGIISTLMKAIIREVAIPLEISKLEGDAIFMFADSGHSADWQATCAQVGEKLIRFIDAFDSALQELVQVNSCSCPPCRHAPELRLKVLGHVGKALRYTLGPFEELAGVDVILVHRLLKNPVAVKSYLLLTENAFRLLRPAAALTFESMALAYEEVGQIQVRVHTPAKEVSPSPLRFAFLLRLWDHLRKFGWRFQFKGISEKRLKGWPDGAADLPQR